MIEVEALSLVVTQVLAHRGDVPRVVHPEFADANVNLAGGGDPGAAFERLCNYSLPQAASAVRFGAVDAHEPRGGKDIEKAVAKLAPDELARFRAWFAEFDAARFDAKIERDAKSGKLDRLAGDALRELREGGAREL